MQSPKLQSNIIKRWLTKFAGWNSSAPTRLRIDESAECVSLNRSEIFVKGKSTVNVLREISSRYWYPAFLGHPVEKSRRSVRQFAYHVPNDRSGVHVYASTRARARMYTHAIRCVGRRRNETLQSGVPREYWTLRAVKVVAYFTSWLGETFSSCRSCVHAKNRERALLHRTCRRMQFPAIARCFIRLAHDEYNYPFPFRGSARLCVSVVSSEDTVTSRSVKRILEESRRSVYLFWYLSSNTRLLPFPSSL